MGNISTDQKLQLVQMIRAESQDNRMKMRSRERMLYGVENNKNDRELPLYTNGYFDTKGTFDTKGSFDAKGMREKELYALEEQTHAKSGEFSSFKFRMVLAAVLFTGFLIVDAGSGNIAGMTTDKLREEINRNFDTEFSEVVFDFEHNFPYTLFMNK